MKNDWRIIWTGNREEPETKEGKEGDYGSICSGSQKNRRAGKEKGLARGAFFPSSQQEGNTLSLSGLLFGQIVLGVCVCVSGLLLLLPATSSPLSRQFNKT